MDGDLISVIVPVYNGERYLSEALQSIFQQNYEPLEIIVIDDGSTDSTAAILARFAERIRFVRQENAGPAAARNRGISESTGAFLAFLDADDLWLPERMGCQHAFLAREQDTDFNVCHIQNFWVDELALERDAYSNHPRGQPVAGYTSAGLLARRQAFERVGFFREELGHTDSADWFLRAKEMGVRGELLNHVLVRRRIHPHSRSRLRSERSSEEFLQLVKRSLDRRRSGEPSAVSE